MVTNIGFDNGHPYLEEGADEGRFVLNEDGRVVVTDAPVPATVGVTLERSIDGGQSWETVVSFSDQATVIDWESLSYGDTLYRATGFTVEGAAATTMVTVEARSDALWLSAGDGFEITGRLPLNPEVSITASRQRALKQYAGRSLPVAYTGEAVGRTVSVSGNTADRNLDDLETANIERLTEIAQSDAPVFMFRDPDGRRIYGSVDQIQMPRQTSMPHEDGWNGWWGYSFGLTETER